MSDLFGLEKKHKIPYGEEVDLLITVHDPVTLGIVRGLLEDERIPYLVHERGAGSALRLITGYSTMGTDIYVPKVLIENAKALVAGIEDGEAIEILPDEIFPEDDTDSEEDTE